MSREEPVKQSAPSSAARVAWDRAQQARGEGDSSAALRWFERAHRLAPGDRLVQLTFGALLLEVGEFERARPELEAVAQAGDVPQAWVALAACELARGAEQACLEALERALRGCILHPDLAALAARAVGRFGWQGWCGLEGDGRVRFGPGRRARILLDGAVVRGGKLPGGWEKADRAEVIGVQGAFVGSPLPVGALCAVTGFVERRDGGIGGWIWQRADPEPALRVLVEGALMAAVITARDPADGVEDLPAMARPRRFELSPAEVAALGTPIAVKDRFGRHLYGSPLDPALDLVPRWADRLGDAPAIDLRRRAVDVVIPVYRGAAETMACIESVLASVAADTVVHVVDDASPEGALREVLADLAGAGRLRLHRHEGNRGFPAAANTGLRAAVGRDVVLLNSDTLVAPGWLDRLRAAVYSAPEVGSATPLSNDATIVSYPKADEENAVPDAAEVLALDDVAQAVNAGLVAEIPVGVGFCLYLRRDCLEQVGGLREDLFAQGYGEENDFCLRARQMGWRHVAALDVFVGHVGGRSFGTGRTALIRRNTALLNRLYPGYDAMIAAHVRADPLFRARRRIDAERFAAGRSAAGRFGGRADGGAVLLVTHDEGGGVEEFVASRAAGLRARGIRPIVLRPGCAIEGYANLRYDVGTELALLAALLRPDRPTRMEVHHLLGHDHGVLALARLLEIPVETWLHDAAAFCPRIALIGRERRYCGEPDVAGCEDCVADLGSNLTEDITVPALLARSAADLAASRRVVVATRDMAQRMRRHFPGLRPEVSPWEDDGALPPAGAVRRGAAVRVVVVGAIGVEKGYDVLLGCVRDARRRGLALDFVVCGYTEDDARLLDAGPVFVTGRYAAGEAVALIRRQDAQLAFIPSIWPETWCFALSRVWQAGLRAVAFDLGAPAERIRARGGDLLPLGLPVGAVNDALLRLASAVGALHSPQP